MTAWLYVVCALGVALRLPSLFRPLWSDDEAIYAVTADAIRRGALLYRDVVDHKPPLVYTSIARASRRSALTTCGGRTCW